MYVAVKRSLQLLKMVFWKWSKAETATISHNIWPMRQHLDWRAAMPLWVISGQSNTSSRFANPGAAQPCCPYSFRSAEKKPEGYPGFKTLKLNRSSLRELAKCLGGTRLEGLRGRKRNFLRQHCEFLGLLGQRFELLA